MLKECLRRTLTLTLTLILTLTLTLTLDSEPERILSTSSQKAPTTKLETRRTRFL